MEMKIGRFLAIFALAYLSVFESFAMDIDTLKKEFLGSGNLATVKIVPKEGRAELFIVGVKQVDIDPSSVKILSVEISEGGKVTNLPIQSRLGKYEVSWPRSSKAHVDVTTDVKGTKDKVRIQLSQP